MQKPDRDFKTDQPTHLFIHVTYVCFAYIYVHHVTAWYPQRPEEGTASPQT